MNPIRMKRKKHNRDWGIRTMADLRREKKRLREDLLLTRKTTGVIIDSLPGSALQGGIDVIVGAIARSIQNGLESTAAPAQPASAPQHQEEPQETPPIADTLKEVGKETMLYAITQLLERFLKLK